MKKVYTKPVLVMDDFTLSQSIAHNCGDNIKDIWNQATLKYKGSCGWDTMIDADGNGVTDIIFVNDKCNTVIGADEFVGVCYNNPEGGWNIFNS